MVIGCTLLFVSDDLKLLLSCSVSLKCSLCVCVCVCVCVCAVRDKKLSTQSHKSKDMFFHAQYMSLPPPLNPLPSSPHFISLYPIEAPFFLGFNFYQLHLQLSVRVDVRGGRVDVRGDRQ